MRRAVLGAPYCGYSIEVLEMQIEAKDNNFIRRKYVDNLNCYPLDSPCLN